MIHHSCICVPSPKSATECVSISECVQLVIDEMRLSKGDSLIRCKVTENGIVSNNFASNSALRAKITIT
jgi:hypothetical protein